MNKYGTSRVIAAAITALGCVVIVGAACVSAADDTIKHVDQHFSGDRVVGGVTMHFVGMNPLTQSVTFEVAATVVTPQPFPSGLTNGSPASAKPDASTPSPVQHTAPAHGRFAAMTIALHCDNNEEVVQDTTFFQECAKSAAQWADDIKAQLDASLRTPDDDIAKFRVASNDVFVASAKVNDDKGLEGYRTQVADLIAGRGAGPKPMTIDAEVRAIGVWPAAKADDARLAIARYRSLIDKTQLTGDQKAALKTRLDDATSEVDTAARDNYNARRQKLIDDRDRILGLAPASYIQDISAPCSGLFGKGLERKITVKVTPDGAKAPSVTDDVTTICPTRSFVSTGFTFVQGGDRTFGTVAPNTAAAPPPAGTTPPNTIVETTRSDVHAASISFVNFRVGGNPRSEDGIYTSFGVIVGSGTNSNADFAAGASYTFARSFVLTLGGFLGGQTQLAPGYTVGGPIAANITNPPTTTTRKIRPFVGITYSP
jgi:hypothetical protein